MDGMFYRAMPKKKRLKSLLKKLKKNRRQSILIAAAFLALVYLLLDNKGIVQRVRLEMRKGEMTTAVEAAKKETERLKSQIKALEGDRKTIEKLAREKYGMARDGETVYRVKKD
ncbi:MAG: septum formation initiator family protein [Ignavibacteriales bacterium]|nr:septum formation initiator family protein [Ignavibacteriales bacterium]